MDREAMIAELDAGTTDAPETEAPIQTPAQPETTGEQYEYYVGDKPFKVPASAEFAIKHNGQLVKVPASKLINGHRQSSHLEQKLKDLSGKYQAYEQKVGPLDAWEKRQSELQKLEALEKWSRENQTDFDRLWQGMQKSQSGLLAPQAEVAGQAPSVDTEKLYQTIQGLQSKLGELEGWKSEFDKKQYEESVAAETKKIEEEAAGFEKKYSKYGVSLDEMDDSGVSLKGRIFKHAVDNNIDRFEIAALSYLGDTLFDRATVYGRTEGVKNAKGDVKAGLVSRSAIPHQGQNTAVDVRKMSPEDRRKAALDELMSAEG